MHKIIQHEDGTLSLGSVDGILNKYTNNTTLKVMAQSETGVAESNDNYTLSGDAYVLFNRLNVHNKLTFTVTASSNEDIFGISLHVAQTPRNTTPLSSIRKITTVTAKSTSSRKERKV